MAESWPPPTPPTPDPIAPSALRVGALVTVAVATGLIVVAVAIWAMTTRDYFWPIWPALPLALVAASVGWIAWVHGDRARRVKVSLGVTITAGLYLAVVLFLVGVWAAAGGGYFWPAWPALGLAVILGLHALVATFVAPQSGLEQRIATLTSTRSAAIDAQEAELRRIERDLHDGAQARLVALGMTIGMAEQKLDQDPAEAKACSERPRTSSWAAVIPSSPPPRMRSKSCSNWRCSCSIIVVTSLATTSPPVSASSSSKGWSTMRPGDGSPS